MNMTETLATSENDLEANLEMLGHAVGTSLTNLKRQFDARKVALPLAQTQTQTLILNHNHLLSQYRQEQTERISPTGAFVHSIEQRMAKI